MNTQPIKKLPHPQTCGLRVGVYVEHLPFLLSDLPLRGVGGTHKKTTITSMIF